MKKKKCRCCFLKLLVCLSGIGAIVWFVFGDKIKEAVFNSKYEDKVLSLLETFRLLLDLLGWPIDYVRALLP